MIENSIIKVNNKKRYSKIYMFTNENINAMLKKIDIHNLNIYNKSILTVASSGDQAFNFILDGASKISLFDINYLTKFYFYFKKALIEKLTYKEFLDFYIPKFFNNDAYFSKNTYYKIRDNIEDKESKFFWDYIFNNYDKESIISLFVEESYDKKGLKKSIIYRNKYLRNEESYNALKNKITNITNIDFYCFNILEEELETNEKFDFIYLSNIPERIHEDDMLKYLKRVKTLTLNFANNLKKDGLLAVSYLYYYLDSYWNNLKANIPTIISDIDKKDNFIKQECSIIDFNGGLSINSTRHIDKDALILYRKKNH